MSDAAALMDDMYRRQRHIYDLSRKFYLLGRDEAIARLRPAPGDKVLDEAIEKLVEQAEKQAKK